MVLRVLSQQFQQLQNDLVGEEEATGGEPPAPLRQGQGVACPAAPLQEGDEGGEVPAVPSLQDLVGDALRRPQAQHQIFRRPVRAGQRLLLRQGRFSGGTEISLQVPGIAVPDAAEVGVGAGAEAQVLLQRPVSPVVAGGKARPGEVGDLVLAVAQLRQPLHGVQVHVCLFLVPR